MVLRDIPTSENAVDWCPEEGLVPYARAVEKMQARASAIREQATPDAVWLVEHPPLYTAGTSANDADLLDKEKFPVFKTGRGGQHT
ncbi:MAG: lipoate-protein ligase B, partial [Rhodospirillaceae bacterium]|nr:lipoate-protein ligase B [Rhodospirillaceae bacterium]